MKLFRPNHSDRQGGLDFVPRLRLITRQRNLRWVVPLGALLAACIVWWDRPADEPRLSANLCITLQSYSNGIKGGKCAIVSIQNSNHCDVIFENVRALITQPADTNAMEFDRAWNKRYGRPANARRVARYNPSKFENVYAAASLQASALAPGSSTIATVQLPTNAVTWTFWCYVRPRTWRDSISDHLPGSLADWLLADAKDRTRQPVYISRSLR